MINIETKTLVGQLFTVNGNTQYSCIGVGQNDTLFVIGVGFDSVNNRSTIQTFKVKDVTFLGDIRHPKI